MGLVLWMPCTKDLHNQGLVGTNPTGTCTYEAGKIGNCAKVTSTIDTGLSSDKWDYSTKSISFGGWFKFNKAEMQAAVLNKNTNTHQSFASFNLLGKDSYNGFALSLYTNNIYNPTADLTSLNIQAHMRSSTASWSCSFRTIEWDTWIHLFITWDFDSKTFTAYKNGAKVGSYTIPNWGGDFTYRGTFNIAENAIFGGNGPAVIMPFRVNDVRVYDHCLSIRELKSISSALVLHYPLNDAYVEGTSNINTFKTITGLCYNRATGQYNYGPATDMYKVDGIFQGKQCTKVYMGTDGLDAHPNVGFHPLHPANGTYKTLSFDYFPTICNNIVFYTHGGSATTSYVVNGIKSTSSDGAKTIPVNIGQWNHIEFTLLGTSASTSGWYYMQIGNTNHTSSTSNYWLFANVQIEEKDHATPYTPNTRNETTVYDCSGYQNNGTISGALSCSADSPRYKNCISFPQRNTRIISSFNEVPNEFTISYWAYEVPTFGINPNNCQGFFCWGNTDLNAGVLSWDDKFKLFLSNTSGSKVYNSVLSIPKQVNYNIWEFWTFTFNGTDFTLYKNGNLFWNTAVDHKMYVTQYDDKSSTGIGFDCAKQFRTPVGSKMSDFRMYATALSADDIKELYNTSAYVSDNGTLLTYNVEE